MTDNENLEIKKLLREADQPVCVSSVEMVKRTSKKKRIRSMVRKTVVVSTLLLAAIGVTAIFQWSNEKPSDSIVKFLPAGGPPTTAATQPIEVAVSLTEYQPGYSKPDLDHSLEHLRNLKSELAELQVTQRQQQFVLLKEQLSRTEINPPQFSLRGF